MRDPYICVAHPRPGRAVAPVWLSLAGGSSSGGALGACRAAACGHGRGPARATGGWVGRTRWWARSWFAAAVADCGARSGPSWSAAASGGATTASTIAPGCPGQASLVARRRAAHAPQVHDGLDADHGCQLFAERAATMTSCRRVAAGPSASVDRRQPTVLLHRRASVLPEREPGLMCIGHGRAPRRRGSCAHSVPGSTAPTCSATLSPAR